MVEIIRQVAGEKTTPFVHLALLTSWRSMGAMTAAQIVEYIATTLPGVEQVTGDGDHYFFYDPNRDIPPDKRQPFATIVHSDAHDTASNLSRGGVYRLNIGVKRDTYRARFGDPPAFPMDNQPVKTGHDFTKRNEVMPHPIYAAMHFVCIVSPSDETFEREVKPLIVEAYEQAKEAHARRSGAR